MLETAGVLRSESLSAPPSVVASCDRRMRSDWRGAVASFPQAACCFAAELLTNTTHCHEPASLFVRRMTALCAGEKCNYLFTHFHDDRG